ncbi:RDD family protein [Microbacterium sp. Se5.02b]|uniref:RDD family protein n=1 Tax=Microbacterium sp. Se5.02b TaxID=2864103 RepID=UPI001C68F069|nr:RDD family protein [Microbacterium sp. Se5.02b]QYM64871.1 RDD family protein [Microbacterium sp. Se5.02b]
MLGGGLLVAASLSGSAEKMLGILLIGGPVVSLVLLGWFVVYTIMQAGSGSIGMRAQGLRLVSAAEGKPLGFGRALLRNIIFGLAAAVVVGYFSPLFDGSGRFQGWHDKVAGSLMLDARVSASAAPASAAAAAIPPAPTTSIPAAPLAPGAGHPAPAASPAPAIPGLPPTAAAPAAPSAAVPAYVPPRPAAPAAPVADAGSLIAFVPGVTQDAPARPAPVVEPELDATVQQRPEPAVAAPPAPSVPEPAAAPAAPAPAAAEPPAPPAPAAASAPAPAPAAAPAPVAFVSVEEDDLEDTRISVPGHRLVFTWDDGTRVSVSRRTIFGRNPAPEEGATLVPVRDETLSLSKTHFEAAAETSGGWVRDRHSTNGMTIVRDGQRIACPAGQRVPIRLGDAIEIGDRIVTIGGYA